uniref:14 kDa salivary protein C n=1 Tax=Phlebotomus arabicus TaxID=578135 RepID=C6G4F7_9DIPT
MKLLLVVLVAVIILIMICHADHPETKCRKDVGQEECITHCEYKYYGFTDDRFRIRKHHRENFRNVLSHYGAIRKDQENDLIKLLNKCAKKVRESPAKSKRERCYKIENYYRCVVVDSNIINYSAYVKAITKLDNSINV